MEEEAKMELKHMCKFCSKSFPCGRSLGGHMRSHLINNNNQSDHHYRRKNERSGSKKGSKPKRGLEYELRGRSRKTWRAADGRNDSPVSSWNSNGQNQRVGSMEIQSDGEEDLKWARRSSRRARYIGINGANNDHKNAYSSVSDVEETEQKDVALSLIMLSMDVGHWGSSFAESSDNNSVFLEEKSSFRANGNMKINDDTKTNTNKNKNKKKCCVNSGDHVKEQKKLGTRSKEFEKEVKKLEFSGYGYQKNECKVSNVEVSANGFVRNELENKCGIQLANGDSSKRKIDDSFSPETKANSIKKIASFDILDSELWKKDEKKSRFECTTCNKAFVSYQALGGHRASHKKLKGCSGSNHEVSENSSQTEVSPLVNKSLHDQEQAKKVENGNNLKKAQNHECPICFKVFPSGQALGGHKRSHLLASGVATDNSNSQINQGLGTHNPTPQTRNFLDLNLPAPADEEAGASIHGGFKPWWVQDTHKPKPLMGLISN